MHWCLLCICKDHEDVAYPRGRRLWRRLWRRRSVTLNQHVNVDIFYCLITIKVVRNQYIFYFQLYKKCIINSGLNCYNSRTSSPDIHNPPNWFITESEKVNLVTHFEPVWYQTTTKSALQYHNPLELQNRYLFHYFVLDKLKMQIVAAISRHYRWCLIILSTHSSV